MASFSRSTCTPSPAICNATGQRSQECHEILFLGDREAKRAQSRIEPTIRLRSAIVIINDLIESGEASVMHVGRGSGNLAKRGCLESAAIFRRAGHASASCVYRRSGPPSHTGIVELFVGEVGTNMTPCATSLPAE